MSYSSYDYDAWENRLRRAVRAERGFPWLVFVVGFFLGAMIF